MMNYRSFFHALQPINKIDSLSSSPEVKAGTDAELESAGSPALAKKVASLNVDNDPTHYTTIQNAENNHGGTIANTKKMPGTETFGMEATPDLNTASSPTIGPVPAINSLAGKCAPCPKPATNTLSGRPGALPIVSPAIIGVSSPAPTVQAPTPNAAPEMLPEPEEDDERETFMEGKKKKKKSSSSAKYGYPSYTNFYSHLAHCDDNTDATPDDMDQTSDISEGGSKMKGLGMTTDQGEKRWTIDTYDVDNNRLNRKATPDLNGVKKNFVSEDHSEPILRGSFNTALNTGTAEKKRDETPEESTVRSYKQSDLTSKGIKSSDIWREKDSHGRTIYCSSAPKNGTDSKPSDGMASKQLDRDNGMVEEDATYDGNMGVMEVFKFFQVANEQQIAEFEQLAKEKQDVEAWRLVQKVTGMKLKGKEFGNED